ncbi:MAG: PAS domain-containing protein [Acidobacteriota bacterium]|nr:PAS domain-containing protein [Acidobacteriota bacterium]
MFRTSKDAIVICDAEGRLVYFNEATRELHGKDFKYLTPEQWPSTFNLYHPDGTLMQTHEVPLFRANQGEKLTDVPMMISPAGERPRRLLASGEPLFDRSGRKLGAVVVMRKSP